ncbi:MAG: magnesium transporter [Candidatus Pelagadaptatus aseana]|uniref:magnesium transporter n=1 Tax=Candidatus Pelagadaptatus aseana TaxID=3120508 RepID=UPI0039B2780E
MQSTSKEILQQTQSQLGEIQDALDSGTFKPIRRMLNGLEPAEIAHLLESSPPPSRWMLWRLIDKDTEGEVLQELSDDIQTQILQRMNTDEVVGITEGLDTDDVADILQQLPDRVIKEVLAAMSARDRLRVESVLSYDEDTAGGLMNTDTITVRPRLTLDVVLRYLRRHEELPASTDNLIVINKQGQFVGLLPVAKILTTSPNITVREVMLTDVEAIPVDMDDSEVANLFERHDWISAPVIDENNRVVGRITIDDVVDVIREDADHSLMSMAGLDEDEDTFATVRRAMPRRATWLGINLITAIIASAVINIFEDTIEKVVALAILMPIVASMGGVAGSQTLTVVIRGMALGQIGRNNINWLLSRELRVGFLNGMLWALILGAITSVWFGDPKIAIIIACAMIINLVTAATAGALLPIILKSLKIDPALAGSVTLTTITDVVGFFAFLGLATYFYS